jgi:hypothetical protein
LSSQSGRVIAAQNHAGDDDKDDQKGNPTDDSQE